MTDGNNMESPNSHRQPGNGETNGLPDTPESGQVQQDTHDLGGNNASASDHPNPQSSTSDDDEQPPPPEPSQTDHLNKSLLTSFLDRLNNPNMANAFPQVQRIDTSDPEEALEIVDSADTN